jgi:serine acetyltransferase
MSFFQVVKEDLSFYKRKFYSDKNVNGNFLSFLESMLFPSFSLVFWCRAYSSLYSSKNKFLRKIGYLLYLRTSRKYSCDIHPCANIGVPFKIGHAFNIVIGADVKIGSGCYIFNGVTLGNKNVGFDNFMPVIGNRVIIGTGAKVLGSINIGDDSIVGANSLVTKNVPANEVWAGMPARFIKNSVGFDN